MKNELLIFTYADVSYDIFVLPYIAFALNSNPGVRVEVAVEDIDNFNSKYKAGIGQLRESFGDAFLIRQSKVIEAKIDCTPNVIRFIEHPETCAEYIYIGDIDLMILEDVFKIHTQYIEKYDLPFSNVIRQPVKDNQPRLTGLHFCRFEQMYPLPDLSDIDLKKMNDEHVLYLIMKRKGAMVPESFKLRPECGVHLSTNRNPLGQYVANNRVFSAKKSLGWGIKKHDFHEKYKKVQKSATYQSCFMYFPAQFKLMLVALEGIFEDEYETLHRYAMDFLVNKVVLFKEKHIDIEDAILKGNELLSKGKPKEAESIFLDLVNICPKKVFLWIKLLQSAISSTNFTLAEIAMEQILSLPHGKSRLSDTDLMEKYKLTFAESVEN